MAGCYNAIRESRIAARTKDLGESCRSVAVNRQSYDCPPRSGLLVDDLDLLVEHRAVKRFDRHASPAEALAKAGAPSNAARLRNKLVRIAARVGWQRFAIVDSIDSFTCNERRRS
jgi:hypothetical protein